jgi:hypothetical protein
MALLPVVIPACFSPESSIHDIREFSGCRIKSGMTDCLLFFFVQIITDFHGIALP